MTRIQRRFPIYDFSSQTVIVTGAASGIGRATAELLHAAGANVVAADLRITADNIASSVRYHETTYDAADPESAETLVADALSVFGTLDHLVLCAGIYETQPVQTMTDEQWRKMIAVNLDGIFYLTRRAAGQMTTGGSIVALASIAAHQGGSFNHAHYGAAKGGVLALVRGLARDLGPQLRVNAVSPGTIDTPMVTRRVAEGGESLIESIPLKRLGQPEDIAQACAFLCSEGAAYITGETLLVAGGLYMG